MFAIRTTPDIMAYAANIFKYNSFDISNENGMVFVICKMKIIPIATPITPSKVFNGLGLLCGAAE